MKFIFLLAVLLVQPYLAYSQCSEDAVQPVLSHAHPWKVRQVSSGNDHTIAIMSDGTLWAWGNNSSGQLGDGTKLASSTPVKISDETDWAEINAGSAVSFAIKTDGSLWAWGENGIGQLAVGTLVAETKPKRVGTDNDWKSVSTSGSHTIALKSDGSIWGWGWNYYYQVGDETNVNRSAPVRIGTDSDWESVSAGGSATAAIKTNGRLWVWGRLHNDYMTTPKEVDFYDAWESVSVGEFSILGIRKDGTLWGWGSNEYNKLGFAELDSYSAPEQVGSDNDWKSVDAAFHHSMGLKADGSLWAWGGYPGFGPLAEPAHLATPAKVGSDTDWIQISAGDAAGFALRADKTLWGWGRNELGEVGDGTGRPVQLIKQLDSYQQYFCSGGMLSTVAVTGNSIKWYDAPTGGNLVSNSTLLTDGVIFYASQTVNGFESCDRLKVQVMTTPPPAPVVNGIVEMECQNSTVSNLTAFAEGVKWYSSEESIVPLGSTTPLANGQTYFASQTINNCESISRISVLVQLKDLPAEPIGEAIQEFCTGAKVSNLDIQGASIHWYASSASNLILSESELLLDGHKYYATQTLDGCSSIGRFEVQVKIYDHTLPAPDVQLESGWNVIASNYETTLGIRKDGTLWGWGYNENGATGTGRANNLVYTPVLIGGNNTWKSISVGYEHGAAIRSDGTLWTWGDNNEFEEGTLGDGTTLSKSYPHQVGTDSDWVIVSAGLSFTLAVKKDGTLWAWGRNDYGQLGDGTTVHKHVPIQIGTDKNWITISTGLFHSGALKADGSLWMWGSNYNGELGINSTTPSLTPVQVAGNWKLVDAGVARTFAIAQDGTLWAWGSNEFGTLGDGTYLDKQVPVRIGTANNWVSIQSSVYHWVMMGVQEDGTLWGWGNNEYGQMADGTYSGTPLYTPTRVGTDTDWQAAFVGLDHVLAIKKDGSLWGWGKSDGGQLGLGKISFSPNTPQLVATPSVFAVQQVCEGAKVSDLQPGGSNIRWYTSPGKGDVLGNDVALAANTLYYIAQTDDYCESNSRIAVLPVIHPAPAPPEGATNQTLCGGAMITDLVISGDVIVWYDQLSEGTLLAPETVLMDNQISYAAQKSEMCESPRLAVTVSLNSPAAPGGEAYQEVCYGATISDLTVSGAFLSWYNHNEGGIVMMPETELVSDNTYYAAQTVGDCESPRLGVTVVVNSPELPSGETNQEFCGSATVADIVVTGTSVLWYDDNAGGNALIPETALVSANTYYATQKIGECESLRLPVTATIHLVPETPAGETPQSFEQGSTLADLIVSGNEIKWHASEDDIPSGTELVVTEELENGKTYFATQTINGCESPALAVTAVLVITGVEDFIPEIKYGPNPVEGALMISSPSTIRSIEVKNSVGQTLLNANPAPGPVEINMSEFVSGLYLIRIHTLTGSALLKVEKK
jgi:alpha-tubulin suppressor-like RCC1 family protein